MNTNPESECFDVLPSPVVDVILFPQTATSSGLPSKQDNHELWFDRWRNEMKTKQLESPPTGQISEVQCKLNISYYLIFVSVPAIF